MTGDDAIDDEKVQVVVRPGPPRTERAENSQLDTLSPRACNPDLLWRPPIRWKGPFRRHAAVSAFNASVRDEAVGCDVSVG
jgi:hypothetical protein